MKLSTTVFLLNKKENEYTARDGSLKQSYRITISQENNSIIAELPVNQELYQTLEPNRNFDVVCEYRSTKNGNYLTVLSAKPSKTAL
ncbi:hypothetical protein AALB39_25725 [Lachnospiraceae bacterium 54-53]